MKHRHVINVWIPHYRYDEEPYKVNVDLILIDKLQVFEHGGSIRARVCVMIKLSSEELPGTNWCLSIARAKFIQIIRKEIRGAKKDVRARNYQFEFNQVIVEVELRFRPLINKYVNLLGVNQLNYDELDACSDYFDPEWTRSRNSLENQLNECKSYRRKYLYLITSENSLKLLCQDELIKYLSYPYFTYLLEDLVNLVLDYL